MSQDRYSPVIRSLHQVSRGAYEQALEELAQVCQRALAAGEKTWAAVLLWHCMIIAENMGDWRRAADYGESVLHLQDDAYLRLFLFRAYRQLGDGAKAAVHLRASVDLADETLDHTFLETLVKSATRVAPETYRERMVLDVPRRVAPRATPRTRVARGYCGTVGIRTTRRLSEQ